MAHRDRKAKYRLRRGAAAVLLASALVGLLPGQAGAAVLLEDELTQMLRDHPKLQAGRESIRAAEENIGKNKADYWPTVSVTADAGPEYISNPTEREDEQLDREWRRTRNVAGLTVTQNLFDGFATTSAVASARINAENSRIALEASRQNTIYEAIVAYLAVLRQKRLIAFARQAEDNIQKQLQLEDERVQRGSGIQVDVLEAKRRLQTAKERRVGFEGGLKEAVSRYTQVFNHAPDIAALVDPVPPMALVPASLDEADRVAPRENPAVANAIANMESAREAQRAARSGFYPTLDLVGSANYEKHKNATLGTRRDYSVLLEANWDLFSGFATDHALGQAAHDYAASQHNRVHTGRKVVEQVRIAWQALETARERKQLLENALNIAHEVWQNRLSLREAGKETVINVLDAENEVSTARINLTSAAYAELQAAYQLLLAMGRLDARHLGLALSSGGAAPQ